MQAVSSDPLPLTNSSGNKDAPVPQRARAACRVCRAKKVRCDAREGKRCSNCAFEGIQCEIVPKRPRRRLKIIPSILPRPPPAPNDRPIVVEGDQPNYGTAITHGHEPQGTTSDEHLQHQGRPTEYHHNTVSVHSEDSPATEIDLPWSPGGAEHRKISSCTARSLSPMHAASTLRSSVQDLPDYIKPVPPHLDAYDIAYLENKDAFTLPHPALRDDCLRRYFQYMHPLYPAVEFGKIWSTIHAPHVSADKLSLLLLHALVFAGGMWADVRLVRRAGFLSRKAFRESLNKRIRVLYDADYEDDRLTLVQSLLLWSFWFRKANDQKDGWYWIGVAHTIATTIDLQYSVPLNESNRHVQRSRRRVWWALCNREVIGAIDLRRAPRFTISGEDHSTISPDDFDYTEAMSRNLPDMIWPSDAQCHVLARLTVEYIKLNLIVGKILSITCYQNTGNKMSVSHSTQTARSPNALPGQKSQLRIDELVECNQELTTWRQQLPDDLRHIGPLPLNPSEWLTATSSHRAALCMMYYMAVMTVHRPQAMPLETSKASPTGATERNRKHAARSQVRHAAQKITEIAMDFFNADLLNFLPATVVSCIMHISIQHTFDTFSDDVTIRNQASRQLDECRAMLYTLAERQFAPSWVSQTIEYILSRAKRRERSSQDGPRSESRWTDDSGADRATRDQRPGLENQPNTYHDLRSAINTHGASLQPPVGDVNSSLDKTLQGPKAVERTSITGMAISGNQSEWVCQFNNNQDSWSTFPTSSMDLPFFPDASDFAAFEDSWLDLARFSDAGTGPNWQTGNF